MTNLKQSRERGIPIILAAGLGLRMLPFSKKIPKCLVKVNNKPILVHILESLCQAGFSEVIIVVGYLENVIKENIGSKYKELNIEYIKNDIFNKTNNMYSLWLAREYFKYGGLIIEGDCVFEKKVVYSLLNNIKNDCWVVNKFNENFNGCMLIVDNTFAIKKLEIVNQKKEYFRKIKFIGNNYKSAGIIKFSSKLGNKINLWLNKEVNNNNINIYYDLVLAKHLSEYDIFIHCIDNMKWYEIDNKNDLIIANSIFKVPPLGTVANQPLANTQKSLKKHLLKMTFLC